MNATQLIDSLSRSLAAAMQYDPNNADLARHLARAIMEVSEIEIQSDDPTEDDYSEGSLPRDRRVAVSQEHRIMVDGLRVATLERYGWGYYGDHNHPDTPSGEWTTVAGDDDQEPSPAWLAVAEAAGIGGDWESYPCAEEEEITEPDEDPDGEFCLWWVTSGEDGGPRTDTRYATLEDARAACQLAEHGLRTTHRGTLLCGYGIGMLTEDGWRKLDDDE